MLFLNPHLLVRNIAQYGSARRGVFPIPASEQESRKRRELTNRNETPEKPTIINRDALYNSRLTKTLFPLLSDRL